MTTISYTCSHCGQDFDIAVSPIIPAQTYGDPDKCHPAEGGECDPDECPECGEKVDESKCHEAASEVEKEYNED